MIPTEETANKMPESISTFLRPTLSLSVPANIAPITQPINAHEAIHPFMVGERSYKLFYKAYGACHYSSIITKQ
jgi:hypothetical protein